MLCLHHCPCHVNRVAAVADSGWPLGVGQVGWIDTCATGLGRIARQLAILITLRRRFHGEDAGRRDLKVTRFLVVPRRACAGTVRVKVPTRMYRTGTDEQGNRREAGFFVFFLKKKEKIKKRLDYFILGPSFPLLSRCHPGDIHTTLPQMAANPTNRGNTIQLYYRPSITQPQLSVHSGSYRISHAEPHIPLPSTWLLSIQNPSLDLLLLGGR